MREGIPFDSASNEITVQCVIRYVIRHMQMSGEGRPMAKRLPRNTCFYSESRPQTVNAALFCVNSPPIHNSLA